MSWHDNILSTQLGHALMDSDLPGLGLPQRHGITDLYDLGDHQLVIATDRAGNGEAGLGAVPFKGEVVTRIAAFWLAVLGDLVPNTVTRIVDPQAILVRRGKPILASFSAHARLTGRLLRAYRQGARQLGTFHLADGLEPGTELPKPVIVPFVGDSLLRREETGLPPELYDRLETLSSRLFIRSRQLARERSVELIDTLYGFSTMPDGLVVIDPLVHSPHLSGYHIDDRTAEDLGEQDLISEWLARSQPSTTNELPTSLRLRIAEAYLALGARFVENFEPHTGPVKNRLTLSLSHVGILA